MAQSVKIADDVMAVVRRESMLHSRSVAGQITHWIKIGRAIEQSDSFDYRRIKAALEAALSPDQLTGEEQEVWFAAFGQDMAVPSEQENAFFAKRRQLGRGVGLNENGQLTFQAQQD